MMSFVYLVDGPFRKLDSVGIAREWDMHSIQRFDAANPLTPLGSHTHLAGSQTGGGSLCILIVAIATRNGWPADFSFISASKRDNY